MADQGKWFKLWVSSLEDPDLENLSVEQWFRWVRLGVYMKAHGNDGVLVVIPPATGLRKCLRAASWTAARRYLDGIPNLLITEHPTRSSDAGEPKTVCTITIKNWLKYQGDYSTERVRRHRDMKRSSNGQGNGNVTRQEEKRREEIPQPPAQARFPTPTATAPATARGGGLQPAGQAIRTLKINGKLVEPEPEIPDEDRMSAEEMESIRRANMGPYPPSVQQPILDAEVEPAEVVQGGDDDVF